MAHTLVVLIPLIACPLGMALMAGVPALVHRARRRRHNAESEAIRADALAEHTSRAA